MYVLHIVKNYVTMFCHYYEINTVNVRHKMKNIYGNTSLASFHVSVRMPRSFMYFWGPTEL
jgi:hypothetical protein